MPRLSRAEFDLESLPEFDNHALVSFADEEHTGLRSVIAVHRANPAVPSFGATRFWHYASDEEGVRDALRLSRGMSYKAALAGLPCGGAKGVIFAPHDVREESEEERMALIEAYAERVNLLGGRFITGTDVGIRQSDLALMKEKSGHIIGFNDNSTEFTALGVLSAVKAALKEAFGSPEVEGRTFAIQGLGKIGAALLADLASAGASKIFISDIDQDRVEAMAQRYPQAVAVPPDAIDRQEADVFCPCALSGAVNEENVPRFAFKVVAGGANNQLASDAAGDALFARGIVYAPDYVSNAGGLIAVFDEYQNPAYERGRVEQAVARIPETLEKIFAESRAQGIAPHRVANALAEKIFNAYA
jgi:leucine dehydrogenase